MTYTATARLVEMDAAAGMLLLEASGMKTRGAGTASATIRFVLEDRGDATLVVVRTTLDVTGRPAQFGRGVVSEVTRKMVEQFAANLAEMVAAGRCALAEEYGVAYQTVRHAMQVLRERGLIITRQGRGTFVAPAARH